MQSATPLGHRIRAARKSLNLSQERFAARLGTTRRRVIAWEGGETLSPHPIYLQRIAELTGQTVDFFLGDGAVEFAGADDEDDEAASLPLSRDNEDAVASLMDALRRVVREEVSRESVPR